MAATLVKKSNAFAAVMYNEDFTKVKQIVPLTVSSFRIYEDDDGNILFRFTWDYDGKTYVLPYQSVIHISLYCIDFLPLYRFQFIKPF